MNVKICACAVVVGSLLTSVASAEPILQLYIEGATYDGGTESWTIAPPGSSSGEPFRLWAIGNVSGPGGQGQIIDVRLSVAYSKDLDLEVTLTPARVGGTGSFTGPDAGDATFTDPSAPAAPGELQQHVVGGSPTLGDDSSLPFHGIYGPDTAWDEFGLGDFTTDKSPIGDFISSFPDAGDVKSTGAQINAYDVSVVKNTSEPVVVHFDLYDTVVAQNHAKFAPFSHDADAEATVVPEPSSMALLGIGITGLAGGGWYRRRKTS